MFVLFSYVYLHFRLCEYFCYKFGRRDKKSSLTDITGLAGHCGRADDGCPEKWAGSKCVNVVREKYFFDVENRVSLVIERTVPER